ncbi:hypothetical protein B0H67DRAFT_485113 [Lasiosphaeris hirsuta]|uniref:WW domain-containing protein n=1 Tax=Lasiosphaeris hirsuta TaxID=260670 RepID=A0AA40AS83_9PEZI|nr:hypothetical protein B0H67DRAFT_485113 [Lasiosphaeris hirsuta]
MPTPSDPPPSYEQATSAPSDTESIAFARRERNGIPLRARRSMEDELRPLPPGWVRAFDSKTQHQFFVDTTATPPRSIWQHPYDDDVFLAALSPAERETIHGSRHRPNKDDMAADTTDDDDSASDANGQEDAAAHVHVPRRRLDRKLKDKLTGTTHAQRAAERRQREHAERDMYQQHQVFRRTMSDAAGRGQPQLLGKDGNGVDVFLEPTTRTLPGVASASRLSPYLSEVTYAPGSCPGPAGRYIRPERDIYGGGAGVGRYERPRAAYGRPGGGGYGGGLGFPLLPLVGGVLLGTGFSSLMF